MLASADTIKVVANALRKWDIKTVVVDPVGQFIHHLKGAFHFKSK